MKRRKRTDRERVPLFRSPEELAATAGRRLLITGAGRAALESLPGSAISTATRCDCGVLVIRPSKHGECPSCGLVGLSRRRPA